MKKESGIKRSSKMFEIRYVSGNIIVYLFYGKCEVSVYELLYNLHLALRINISRMNSYKLYEIVDVTLSMLLLDLLPQLGRERGLSRGNIPEL